MQRVVLGVVLLALASAPARAGKRPWEEKKEAAPVASVLPDIEVIDPNARDEAERQRAIDKAFITIDLDQFSDTPVATADRPDPELLVALRGAPPAPSEREADKVYLSAPAAPPAPAK
jgi:hypothetical protein